MARKSYPSPHFLPHKIAVYLVKGAVVGVIALALVGAVLALVGYQLQETKTYDLWTHAINGFLTGAALGAVVGMLSGAVVWLVRKWLMPSDSSV